MRKSISVFQKAIILLISTLWLAPTTSALPIAIIQLDPDLAFLGEGTILDDNVATVGENIWFSIADAHPNEPFNLTLKDEGGEIVRCSSGVADAEGNVIGLLWSKTGVIGEPASTYSGDYWFDHYTTAQTQLAGRTFTVELKSLSSCSTPITELITFSSDPNKVRIYFSDALGRPRLNRQTGDTIYLRTENLGPRVDSVRIFLIDPAAPWVPDPNDPSVAYFADVRPGFPSGQLENISGPDNIFLIDNAPPGQELLMIVRTSESGNPSSVPLPDSGDYDASVPAEGPIEENLPLEEEECLECVQ